jgi:hypothetical protein
VADMVNWAEDEFSQGILAANASGMDGAPEEDGRWRRGASRIQGVSGTCPST